MATKSPLAFRRQLKGHRDGQNLSQERLAERSKMDHSLLSRLESGHRAPTVEAVNKIANGLALVPRERDRLLMLAGFMPVDAANAIMQEEGLQSLYRYLTDADIPQADRALVRDLVDRLAALAWGRRG